MSKQLNTTSVLSGAKIELQEDRYKADFELLDRYVFFSAEISRLSLLGIGAIGYTISLVLKDGGKGDNNFNQLLHDSFFIFMMLAGLTSLSLSSALALAHRYSASDGLYYHLRAIKYIVLKESKQSSDQYLSHHDDGNVSPAIQENEHRRNRQFRNSGIYLNASAILLSLGIISSGIIFGYALFYYR